MPKYSFLFDARLDAASIEGDVATNAIVGVPYTDEMIQNAALDLQAQAGEGDAAGLLERYGDKVNVRDFDGNPSAITEMDALIAYMQMLGTLVDFTTFEPVESGR